MKLQAVLSSVAFSAFWATLTSASSLFAGNNLYYAAGVYPSARKELFAAMQAADMKVLRVWLDGQDEEQKGSNIMAFPDLEPTWVGDYNDTVLDRLDDVMVDAHNYGIKLLISMHSWNALAAGDIYDQWYGTGDFYTDSNALTYFDNRLVHVMTHVHKDIGTEWRYLPDYIFGFEAENEAMIGNGETFIEDNLSWQCDRAQTIKTTLGDNSGILTMTGGESWMSESVMGSWLDCEYLDVISIHSYGTGDFETSAIQTYVQQAEDAGKMLIYEEWGACYYDTSNNDCDYGDALPSSTRNANLQSWGTQIFEAGLPWLYWELIPNADPHWDTDYEIGITDDASLSTLTSLAQSASGYSGPFNYAPYIL